MGLRDPAAHDAGRRWAVDLCPRAPVNQHMKCLGTQLSCSDTLKSSILWPARRRQYSMAVPRIGVGVFVFASRTSNRYLLGKRLGSHGAGEMG